MKLNHTDNGNGQMAIIDENLRCVAFVPKLHHDSEKYIKLFENAPELLEEMKQAVKVLKTVYSFGATTKIIERWEQLILKATE